MNRKIFIAALIALSGFLIVSCFYKVDVTEYVVITQFGKPVRNVTEPGLRIKLPLPFQTVNRFDRRKRLYSSRLMEFLAGAREKKNIVVKFYVCWGIADPMLFLTAVGNDTAAMQKLDDILTATGGAALGDFEFDDLINVNSPTRIPELNDRIMSEISSRVKKDYGIEVHKVGISRLALPEANVYSVYNRMRAERKAIANKYRAEGQEKAAIIKAKAEREKSDILSASYMESQKIMGEGEAQAARIYAEAFKKDPDFYAFWRTLESYRKVLDEKTTLVLDEDSELFQYLK